MGHLEEKISKGWGMRDGVHGWVEIVVIKRSEKCGN
jgi:hypothetical protein